MILVRMLRNGAAASAMVMAGLTAAACTQQNPVSPSSAAGSVVLGDQGAQTAASANSELLCHARGNGTFAPLWVNANAVAGHLGHGDGRPNGPVPGRSQAFSATCELVATITGTWLGESITYDPYSGCGRDRNEYRLSLTQSGNDVTGEVYWKILESFFPPDVGMEQTAPLTAGTVSGNTFTFSYGPPSYGLVATTTFTDTTMTGTITLNAPSCPTPNTFVLTRQ